ncbi:ABC transporter ATP-binding protein [Patescibacteria group bacterium]|nr:ABC transporter ATP-binding protein [Patescibacteria group bacterium]MBU4458601.1 ABC transporter ATP-binding protein [Patescibacteria group bacterium]MCG2696262.1 ABC transporter ATP-binding protein [Candidatus Portnoybacteria bacterium]
MLEVKNLKKHFGGVKAVDDCDFEVQEKTITALIGPNGSGKTTVFNLISGILKPEKGKIIFSAQGRSASGGDNIDITNLNPEKIARLGISRLFQQSRLFGNLTVMENLLIVLDNEDEKFWKNLLAGIWNKSSFAKATEDKEKKAKAMLEMVDMEKFSNKLSRDLSFGQKRLVELARTILNSHKLLMLDEPVGGVNPKLRQEIAKILLKLREDGETILLIEHDMNFTLNIADKVIVMDEGKVIAEGNPAQIKTNLKVLEAYLGE